MNPWAVLLIMKVLIVFVWMFGFFRQPIITIDRDMVKLKKKQSMSKYKPKNNYNCTFIILLNFAGNTGLWHIGS